MLEDKIFLNALKIKDPWYIEKIDLNEEENRLDIYVSFRRGSTFSSKIEGYPHEYKAYDTRKQTWRHLNFFEYECYIHCRTPRIKPDDHLVEQIAPPWKGVNLGFTLHFEAKIIQLSEVMTVKNLSQYLSINDDRLWRLLKKYVAGARAEADYSKLKRIGIDETKKKRP